MKQTGKLIIGDSLKLDVLTKNWNEVSFHPVVFYRNEDKICEAFLYFEGLCTAIDVEHSVLIRISSDIDAEQFLHAWCEYL